MISLRRVTPALVERLERWLAMNAPLVWRTRVLWAAWWALVLGVLAAAVAWFAPRGSLPIWPEERLWLGASLAAAVSGAAAVAWAATQVQTRLPVLRARKHAAIAALNVAAILLLGLPAHVFVLVALCRTAAAVPDDVFEADYKFHQQHGFWRMLGTTPAAEIVRRNRVRLDASLARLGLRTDGEVEPFDQFTGGEVLHVWPSERAEKALADYYKRQSEPTLVKERAVSVHRAKQFWNVRDSEHRSRYARLVVWQAMCTLALVVALAVGGMPRHTAVWHAWKSRGLRVQLLPAWFLRFDRWLLLRVPNVWGTGIHLFAWYALLAVVVFGLGRRLDSTLVNRLLELLVPLGFALLQVLILRGRPSRTVLRSDWLTNVHCTLLLVPIAAGAAWIIGGSDSLFLVAVELFFVFPFLLIRNYGPTWLTFGALVFVPISLVAWFFFGGTTTSSFSATVCWLAAICATMAANRITARLAPRWFYAGLVGSTPGVLFSTGFAFALFVGMGAGARRSVEGMVVGALYDLAFSMELHRSNGLSWSLAGIAIYLVYSWLLWPVGNALLRAHAEPRR